MPALPVLCLLASLLASCGTTSYWHETKSWLDEKKGPDASAPIFVPLSIVPERPKIKKLK